MGDELAPRTERSLADDPQAQQDFLDYVSAHRGVSVREAIALFGYRRKDVRALLEGDDDFRARYDEARGRNIEAVEAAVWRVATDPDHPAWDRANARVLKAYHPAFRDRVEMTGAGGGPMEVVNPDVAAAIERFTAAVVQLAARGRAQRAALDASQEDNDTPEDR